MQVLDTQNKIMAWRNVLISEANRCFCVWKCECACTTIENQEFVSKCQTMSKERYNNAGFRGALPPTINHNTESNIIHLQLLLISMYMFIVFLIGKIIV